METLERELYEGIDLTEKVLSLKEQGWIAVKDHIPPRGESILLGELIDGVLHCFYTEVIRPYKNDNLFPDCFCYRNGNYLYALRSDMYWKDK